MIRNRTGQTYLFNVVVLLLLVTVCGAPAKLPTTSSFLQEECDSYIPKYLPLVTSMLGKYRTSGLLITDILSLHGWEGSPQVIVVNGTLLTISEPHLNVAANLIPLLVKLSSRMRLPDLALAGDIMDQPEDDISRHGGPWFGYCNMMFQTTNLMYPAGSPVEEPPHVGLSVRLLQGRIPASPRLSSSEALPAGCQADALLLFRQEYCIPTMYTVDTLP